MENKKRVINFIIIISSIIVIGLLSYVLFFNKSVDYFNLVDSNIKLKIGSTRKLAYFLSDDNQYIEWTSNNDVVSVNSFGEVTANDYGDAIITGKVIINDKEYYNSCMVTTYTGDIGVSLQDINVLESELYLKPNNNYSNPFTMIPNNSYITSVNYSSSNENVLTIIDNKIVTKNEGTAILSMDVNNQVTKRVLVQVSVDAIESKITNKIRYISLEDDFTIELGESKTLSYDIEPGNGDLESMEWYSSDESVLTVNDGIINTKNIGEAVVKLVVNDELETTVKVKVISTNSSIVIDYNPKTTIKVGETININANIMPLGINDEIVYRSSNPMVVGVNNGTITGISSGTATVTLSIASGKMRTFRINVLPRNGSIKGSANLWGYKSLNDKTPALADLSFFRSLAIKGIGILQNNKYIISNGNLTFTYDIKTGTLLAGGKKIKVRIFYPRGVDLSTTNTLTFMGGRGETNFDGLFAKINKNPSIVKSGGILVLVAEGEGFAFDGDAGAYATMFAKAITKQKGNVKNSILGFSDGAHKVMHASNKVVYDKIIVFSGYTDGVESLTNAKNSEVMFIIAPNDGNYSQAQHALRSMKDSGYRNVTIISNGTDMINKFADKFLVIIPGNLMKNAHDTINILNSGIISYAND